MSRRRRAALLLGLALLLGGLAASDVARREAAVRRQVGPAVGFVVARNDLPAGTRLTPARLAVRRVPARFAPVGASGSPQELVGQRLAVPLRSGSFVSVDDLDHGAKGAGAGGAAVAAVARGQRAADLIAIGAVSQIQPGSRVDVLVTRDRVRGKQGRTTLALENAEVLTAGPAAPPNGARSQESAPRVALSLRVTLRQAVYLAAAQSFARELRVLPRAAGDDRRGAVGLTVGSDLK
ncbi:MAG TPA: Flp pilus assembly protein CpaB [Solirubrobacteraceae bacterium]|nr:Flp pilus assembly protein CpaB [Solirubrobacteraceae bacterium]